MSGPLSDARISSSQHRNSPRISSLLRTQDALCPNRDGAKDIGPRLYPGIGEHSEPPAQLGGLDFRGAADLLEGPYRWDGAVDLAATVVRHDNPIHAGVERQFRVL